ncbi:MAG: hypothetical protein JWR63_4067, partial [Conexibacter sp.]|nr:hypothetical protein [Conexibacter sp.]
MPGLRRLRSLLLAAAAVTLGAAAPAAAEDWSPAAALFGPADVSQYAVTTAGNAAGDGLVAWNDADIDAQTGAVRVVRRFRDGRRSAPQVLTTRTSASDTEATVTPDGTGIAVWSTERPGVEGAVLPADGSAAQPFFLSEPRNQCTQTHAKVGSDAAGGAVIAWEDCYAAFISDRPAGGSFQPALRIPRPAVGTSPYINGFDLAVGADGTTAVLLYDYETVWVAVRPAGATAFTLTALRSTAAGAGALDEDPDRGVPMRPAVAVGADGTVAATWMDQPSGGAHELTGAVRPAGGSWWVQHITDFSDIATWMPVVVDRHGNATIAFSTGGAEATTAPAGGRFGAPVQLGGPACDVAATTTADGGTYVAWRVQTLLCQGDYGGIYATHRAAGATGFGAVTTVVEGTDIPFPPAIAPLGAGGAILAWSRGQHYRDDQVVEMATAQGADEAPVPAPVGGGVQVDPASVPPGPEPAAAPAPAPAASPGGANVVAAAAPAASGTPAPHPAAALAAPHRCRVPSVLGR